MTCLELIFVMIPFIRSFHTVTGDTFCPYFNQLFMSLLKFQMPLKSRKRELNFLFVTHYKSLVMSLLYENVQGRIYGYFSILCQHFVSVSNEVHRLIRGCNINGTNTEGCSSVKHFNTCTTACSDDLCNSQNETTIRREHILCFVCHASTYPLNNSDPCIINDEHQPVSTCYAPRTCFTTGHWSQRKREIINLFVPITSCLVAGSKYYLCSYTFQAYFLLLCFSSSLVY